MNLIQFVEFVELGLERDLTTMLELEVILQRWSILGKNDNYPIAGGKIVTLIKSGDNLISHVTKN
jgi:hypothetical protein